MANQPTRDPARLQAAAAESRLRVLESQLALGFTFCKVAETEMDYGHFAEARQAVEGLKHAAESIRVHLNDENQLPATAQPDLRKRLEELETRVEEVEARLRNQVT